MPYWNYSSHTATQYTLYPSLSISLCTLRACECVSWGSQLARIQLFPHYLFCVQNAIFYVTWYLARVCVQCASARAGFSLCLVQKHWWNTVVVFRIFPPSSYTYSFSAFKLFPPLRWCDGCPFRFPVPSDCLQRQKVNNRKTRKLCTRSDLCICRLQVTDMHTRTHLHSFTNVMISRWTLLYWFAAIIF